MNLIYTIQGVCVALVDSSATGSGVDERATGSLHDGDSVAVDDLSAHGDGLNGPPDSGDHIGDGGDDLFASTVAEPLTEALAHIEDELNSSRESEDGGEDGVTCVHDEKCFGVCGCGSDEVVELTAFREFVPSGGLKLCPALASSGATVGNGLKLVGGGAVHGVRSFDLNII